MEALHSAQRLGFETSLRWFVFDDDEFTGDVITVDNERININPQDIDTYYKSGDGRKPNIRLSPKMDYVAKSSKKRDGSKSTPKKEVDEKYKKESTKPKPESKKKQVGSKTTIYDEPHKVVIKGPSKTTASGKPVDDGYHKVIHRITSENGFSIDVDGSYESAVKLKNELSKGRDLTVRTLVIRSVMKPVDTYYVLERHREGTLVEDIDYDSFDDAERRKNDIMKSHPNDVVSIYHVEEVI